MRPILFAIGPLKIYSYAAFISIGILVLMFLAIRQAKKESIDPLKIIDLVFIIVISGFLGAKVFAVFTGDAQNLDLEYGGQVYYGGFMSALLMGNLYIYLARLPIWRTLDLISTYLPLAHAFGRIGCFFEGCCYGKPSYVVWAIQFPKWMSAKGEIVGSPAFLKQVSLKLVDSADIWSLPVHPTQLYESVSLLIIFCLLLAVRKYRRFNGQIFCCYLLLYGIVRFTIEFYRGDNPQLLFNLTISQLISILAILFGTYLLYRLYGLYRLNIHRNIILQSQKAK